ncbi:MAG: dynamin family protein, partial [Syntrophales bacterium]|nr:dynamin family protein [Syntrophales bacterium]
MEAKVQRVHSLQHASDRLLEIVDQACKELQIVSLNRQIDVCRSLVSQKPLIDVAILGQFKAGKSSFLNSLIGKHLLPVGVIPVTTAITRIKYGDTERAVVSHFDGTTTEIALADLDEYTSEARNPANRKDVEVVDVELPSLEDYAGIRLVDTPGLGSVFKYHMETSENWLPEVGAAILAVSADRPLSEHDLALLRDLLRHTPRIVILLTKADLLTAEQQKEVVRFFQDTLKRELNRDFPIFLYSIRDNMDKFKHRLERELLLGLSANRDVEFAGILQYKVQSLGRACRNYLEIALETSCRADTDRKDLRRQILGEQINLTQIEEELIVLTRAQAIHTRTNIDKYLERFQNPLHDKLVNTLKEDIPAWRGNLWKLTRRYEQWLHEHLSM